MKTILALSVLFCLLPLHARPLRGEFSVLVIPARHGHVQVSMDLVEREPVVLLTYDPQSPADAPFLHIWRESSWVRVPESAFANGSFLLDTPSRVVVVGPPSPIVAWLVEKAVMWSPREVLNVENEDPIEMLNALGRMLQFRNRDWQWFAARYVLELEDVTAGQPQLSWYDTFVASDLPPPTNPFRRRRDPEPEPGLRPIIRLEPVPEAEPAGGQTP